MKRKDFIITSAVTGLGLALAPKVSASYFQNPDGTFTLPSLAYAYDALVPHIDETTMKIHHSKHFQGYTNKLNKAIAGTPFEQKGIEVILAEIKDSDTQIRNNAGGYYNHALFFGSLAPNPKKAPEGKLLEMITQTFGSVEDFKKEFNAKAKTVFGSGWAWLIVNEKGALEIVATSNQDNPLMSFAAVKGEPLLGIDVWEHAYYLNYQNKRLAYIEAFWNVLDWSFVEKRLAATQQ